MLGGLLEKQPVKTSETKSRNISLISESREILWDKYFQTFNFYFSKPVNEILADVAVPHVIMFKDYLYYDDEREFLRRCYSTSDFSNRIEGLANMQQDIGFTMRPTLIAQKQSNIIMRRNLQLQKLYINKISAEGDNQQPLLRHVPLIPRYLEDVVFSSNALSETLKSKSLTPSATDNRVEESFLRALKCEEEQISFQKQESLIRNVLDSRLDEDGDNSKAENIDSVIENYSFNSILKEQIGVEPMSLASSFEKSQIHAQIIQGAPSLNSSGKLSEESFIGLISRLRTLKETNLNPVLAKSVMPIETTGKQKNHVVKKIDRLYDQSADPRVALQHFSKSNLSIKSSSRAQSNPLLLKIKSDEKKKTRVPSLFDMASAELKKDLKTEYQVSSLADKVLSEKPNPPSFRVKNVQSPKASNGNEKGLIAKLPSSPKHHQIDLTLNSPRDLVVVVAGSPARALSPIMEKKSLTISSSKTPSKTKDEKQLQLSRRSPLTTQISLSVSSLHNLKDNFSEVNCNKPKASILAAQTDQRGHEGLETSRNYSYHSGNKLSENKTPPKSVKEERLRRPYLKESIPSNLKTRLCGVETQLEVSQARVANNISPRYSLKTPTQRKQLPLQLTTEPSQHDSLKHNPKTLPNKHTIHKELWPETPLSDKKSTKPTYRFLKSKGTSVLSSLKALRTISDLSGSKTDKQLTKDTSAKFLHTKEMFLSRNDSARKSTKADSERETSSFIEQRPIFRVPNKARATFIETEVKDFFDRRNSDTKEFPPRKTCSPGKQNQRVCSGSNLQVFPRTNVELKGNSQKMGHKPGLTISTHEDYRGQAPSTSERAGGMHYILEKSKSPPRKDFEK